MTATKTLYPASIQCWPGGKQLYYTGDPHGDDLRVHTGYDDHEGRPASLEDERTIKVQLMAATYVERDVLCCDTSLVSELLSASWEGGGSLAEAFSWEEVENLRPDPSDWDLERCKEWLEDNGHDLPDPNPWAMTRDELLRFLGAEYDASADDATTESLIDDAVLNMEDGTAGHMDVWQDAVRDNATDAEVMQWFRVTKWLCKQLRSIGEVVLDNDHGAWFGRQACGQAMIMDGTFQKIAENHVD